MMTTITLKNYSKMKKLLSKSEIDLKRTELKEHLRRLYRERGNKQPRTIDIQNDSGGPDYATYIKYFGSWQNALKESGTDKDN